MQPESDVHFGFNLTIAFFLLPDGQGVLTGGAAKKPGLVPMALEHGMTELLRHAIGLKNFREKPLLPQSAYEERLVWMGTQEACHALFKRLSCSDSVMKVPMPEVEVDKKLASPYPFMSFHHFLFHNHPVFIGYDKIEKLCL